MPPPLSLREGIFLDVLAALATITTANGYGSTLAAVTRGIQAPLETHLLPSASLCPETDEPLYRPQTLERQLTLTVRLWVDTATPATAAAALELLIADVEQALVVDPRRGGLAEDTRETLVTYVYLQSVETLAGADVSFQVDYLSSLTSARIGV